MCRALLASACLLIAIVISPANAQVRTVGACDVDRPPANCANMYALEIKQNVPNGAYVHVPDPGCMNDATGDIQKIISGAVSAANPNLAIFSGSIGGVLAGPVGDYLKSQGGDIGKYFSPYAKNGAMCAPIVAVVPAKATIEGYRYGQCDSVEGCRDCLPGADCRWCMFQGEPVVQNSSAVQTATSVFMNWSGDRTRTAVMTIFYTSPVKPLKNM